MKNKSYILTFKKNYLKLNIFKTYLVITSLMLSIFAMHKTSFVSLSILNIFSIFISRLIINIIHKYNKDFKDIFLYIFILDFSYLSYLTYSNLSLAEERLFIFDDHLIMPIIFSIAHLVNLFTLFLIKWINKIKFFQKIIFNFNKSPIYFYFTFSEKSYLTTLGYLSIGLSLITLFARKIGILGLGLETIELPFKIAGIINTFILTISPILFIFLLDICTQNRKLRKYTYLTTILIFLTYLYVSITINSRGFFIYVLALIILYFMFYCNYNLGILKKIFTYLIPISFFLTIILTSLRDIQSANLESSEYFTKIYYYLGSITRRVFPLFKELIKYIQHTKEIVKIDQIQAIGNFQKYNTLIIDKYPPDLVHSSGSTTLADSYLIMGFFGVLIFLFVLSLTFHLLVGKTYKILDLPSPALIIIDITLIGFAMDSSILSYVIFGYKNIIPLIFILLGFILISKTNFIKLIFQSKS